MRRLRIEAYCAFGYVFITPFWFGYAIVEGCREFGREFLDAWRDRSTHADVLEERRRLLEAKTGGDGS